MESLLVKEKQKNTPKIFLLSVVVSLLVLAVVSLTILQFPNYDTSILGDETSQDVVELTCATTLYPELCLSTVKSAAPAAIKTTKDVIFTALNHTIEAVERNYFKVRSIGARSDSLTLREWRGLHDCVELIDNTLENLLKCKEKLKDYGFENYSLADHKDDIMILLSAALANQQTCYDGFSHDSADNHVREALLLGHKHVTPLVSNVLAMIKKLADSENVNSNVLSTYSSRVLEDNSEWPEWLSEADRRLLQSSAVAPNVTVAHDGTGDYCSITDAVKAAPERSSTRYVIKIKAGVYNEYIEITSSKPNLMFIGDGRKTTFITGNHSVAAGWTVFQSATVIVAGQGFLAANITFENTAGPDGNQAVALRVNSDFCAFYRCGIQGYQDTLHVHSYRQFYTTCFISGTVDFIFGNAAVVFQNCNLRPRRPKPLQMNIITGQERQDPNEPTGIVIQKCQIGPDIDLVPVLSQFHSYLGRPRGKYSRTIVMQTEITNVIDPAGWHKYHGDFAIDTLYFAEYKNKGKGANTTGRVTWKGFHILTKKEEAQPFTAGNFINANNNNWLEETGFPYQLGL